jgi:hypothetical protein
MKGLLLQPGRDEERFRSPGGHRVTGCAAISRSRRAASSSGVSPVNTRLLLLGMRLGCTFLTKLIGSLQMLVRRCMAGQEPQHNVYALLPLDLHELPNLWLCCRPRNYVLWALLLHNPAQFTSLVVRQAPRSSEELPLRKFTTYIVVVWEIFGEKLR